jgi:hypothetical protein
MHRNFSHLLTALLLMSTIVLASCRDSVKESPSGVTPNLKVSPVGTTYIIDVIGPVTSPMNKTVSVSGAKPIEVTGWAIDEPAKSVAGNVDVVVDNVPYTARYGVSRKDVADYLKDAKYELSGFEYSIPPQRLAKGRHTVSIRVVSRDGKTYVQSPDITITVE